MNNDHETFNSFQRFYFSIMRDIYCDDDFLLAEKCMEMERLMTSNSKVIMTVLELNNNKDDMQTIKKYLDNGEDSEDALIIYHKLEMISEHICELRVELITINACLKYYTLNNNENNILNRKYNREIIQYAVMYDCYQRLFNNIHSTWMDNFCNFYNQYNEMLGYRRRR